VPRPILEILVGVSTSRYRMPSLLTENASRLSHSNRDRRIGRAAGPRPRGVPGRRGSIVSRPIEGGTTVRSR
jgi:hypothetical protein